MPLFDWPLDQLRSYMPPRNEPADFDSFWQQTLAEARALPLDPQFERVDYGLATVDTFDVTFRGVCVQAPLLGSHDETAPLTGRLNSFMLAP